MVALLRSLGADVEFDTAQRRVWVRAANVTSHGRRRTGARRQDAGVVSGRRTIAGPVRRESPPRHPVAASLAPAQSTSMCAVSGKWARRSRRRSRQISREREWAARRPHLHGLPQPHRHRKSADGRGAGRRADDDRQRLVRAGDRRPRQHAQSHGRTHQRTRFPDRSSSRVSIACTASPNRSCRTGSKPVGTRSAPSSPAAK